MSRPTGLSSFLVPMTIVRGRRKRDAPAPPSCVGCVHHGLALMRRGGGVATTFSAATPPPMILLRGGGKPLLGGWAPERIWRGVRMGGRLFPGKF